MSYPAVIEELQSAATISATETLIGKEINVQGHSFLGVYIDYTKGDETGLFVVPYALHVSGGDEHQYQTWTAAAGTKTSTVNKFSMTATGKYYFVLDIRGVPFIRLKDDADGGSPTGTAQVTYALFQ